MFSLAGLHFDGAVCVLIGKHLGTLDLKLENITF